jgi:gliding motility-associated protein GldC
MTKKSEIKFTVQLDDKNMPEKIEWEATDSDLKGKRECKSIMLSLWDKEENATMAIDLWTKEMLVDDMNIHFHQIFSKMADTYKRSTGNDEVSRMIKVFSADFADKLKIFKT